MTTKNGKSRQQEESGEKVVSVSFVGAEDVLQHIVALKEKKVKTSQLSRKRVSYAPSPPNTRGDDDDDDEMCRPLDEERNEEEEQVSSDIRPFRVLRDHDQQSSAGDKAYEMFGFKAVGRRRSSASLLRTAIEHAESARSTPHKSTDLDAASSTDSPHKSDSVRKDHPASEQQHVADQPDMTPRTPTRRSAAASNSAAGRVSFGTPQRSSSVIGPTTPRSILKKTHATDSGNCTPSTAIRKSKRLVAHKTPNRLRRREQPDVDDCSSSDVSSEDLGDSSDEEEKEESSCPARSGVPVERGLEVEEVDRGAVEGYFEVQADDVLTSDRTLDRLSDARMDTSELLSVLNGVRDRYETNRERLRETYREQYRQWMVHMCYGFNILLHGVGSKHKILEEFREEMLSDFKHVVVNGYFPSLNIKQILAAVSECLLGTSSSSNNPTQQINSIRKSLADVCVDWFLVIHSIDGAALRSEKSQLAISQLTQIPGCHIVASIDHINSSLLWDQMKACRLRWLWKDVTTFDFYREETSYETSMLVNQTGYLALSSIAHIMNSLTSNARGIFNIIVQYQLDHSADTAYEGMSLSDLYQRCRESFLVNSELTLRTQLIEFKDHKLIKTKKGADGSECLIIPLDSTTLQQYMSSEQAQ